MESMDMKCRDLIYVSENSPSLYAFSPSGAVVEERENRNHSAKLFKPNLWLKV